MKFVPHIVMSVAVAVLVAYGLYVTKNPACLWGLVVYIPIGDDVMGIAKHSIT